MKYPVLVAIISLIIPLSAHAGGSAGGWGVVADNRELTMEYVGEFDNLSLLKASKRTFSAIAAAENPNVTLRLHDRVISGRILEPEFADAVSIETEEGENVVIVKEAGAEEQPAGGN
ncbi:MAG TPA: hypothetical protein VFO10_18260 [Oligoflexus sp.]|uniref:hypothetical protein n=1 Tax=Oligoflexus sp. TaxID=1971216 RepID=UPI002D80DF4E|nr:hypothetical protein [Oligoflexus sp.]HET9239210.1 hypothetical protein [Oligoflexus sp.]